MHDERAQGHEIACSNLSELQKVAQEIIAYAGDSLVWVFDAEMGAGKTTLIRQIAAELKVLDNVSSPTLSLVNEYATATGEVIYHFDFYRLKNEAEAWEIGIEEYLDSGHLCLIEWPSKVASLLPEEVLEIRIVPGTEEARTIYLKYRTL